MSGEQTPAGVTAGDPSAVGGPSTGTATTEKPTGDKSTAELLRDLSQQTTFLVHSELELAKAELAQKGRAVGIGAGLFGGAGLVAVFGVGALVTCAIAGLSEAMAVWLAALIVAAVLLAVAGILALRGRSQIKQGTPPVPKEAISSTKEDVAWLKTQAKSARQ